MRRLFLLGGLLILLLIGGGLTAQLITSQGAMLPVLTQTANPDAAPTTVLPWKAEQFFLLIGFALFNLVGIALTIAFVLYLLDRGLRRNRESVRPNEPATARTE